MFHWVPPSCLHCGRLQFRWVFLFCAGQRSQTGHVRTDFQFPSACSHGSSKAKRALPQPAVTDKVLLLLPLLDAVKHWARLWLCWRCPEGGWDAGGGATGLAQFSCSPVYAAWSSKDVVSAPCVTSWCGKSSSDEKASKCFSSFRYQVLLKAERQRWELPDRYTAVFFSLVQNMRQKKSLCQHWKLVTGRLLVTGYRCWQCIINYPVKGEFAIFVSYWTY